MTDKTNAVQRICAMYDSLSATDQRIATFMLDNRTIVPDMAMRDIADRCNTSSPTVSRFVRRLGYENFADLRLSLARSESVASHNATLGTSTGAISFDHFDESIDFILSCKTAELTDTVAYIDRETIEQVVQLLLHSDTVLVTGVGNTLTIAENMAFKLRHIGVRAIAPSTTENAASYSFMMSKHDTMVLISSSGLSQRLKRMMDIAEDNGTPVVFITSNPESPLAARADHVIMTCQRDRLFAYGVPFSHNSVNFIVEVLFLFLHSSSADVEEHVRLFSHTYDNLDKAMDFRSGEFIELDQDTEVD